MAMGKTHMSVANATALSASYGWIWMQRDGWLETTPEWIQRSIQGVNDFTGFQVDWLNGYTLPFLSSVPFISDDTIGAFGSLILLLLGVSIFVLCNLLPDIDSSSSILGRHVPTNFGGHRGVIHSLYPVFALIIPAIIWQNFLLWLIPLGYFTHLLLDDSSVSGVHWLPGITSSTRPYSIFRYEVNGWFEKTVLLGGSWIVTVLFGYLWIRFLFQF